MLHGGKQNIACRNRMTCKEDDNQWQSRLGSDTCVAVAIQANKGCFPPENKIVSSNKDKCCQLQHVTQQLDEAVLVTFAPGENLSFDEGGVACRSRMCPVCQNNKDKPDKCHVDFFLLVDASKCFICHLDFCQGENDSNSCIDKQAAELPTTQKAAFNSTCKAGLDIPSPLGCRHFACDNQHQCPELAALQDLFNRNIEKESEGLG